MSKSVTPSHYFDFSLTQQQEQAFLLLNDFIEDTGKRIFILKGYAGTGKTTLVGGLIKRIIEIQDNSLENQNTSEGIHFTLLASTGQAAKILKDKSGYETRTVHSQIYNFRDLNEDLEKISQSLQKMEVDNYGQLKLIFDLEPPTPDRGKMIYIVDESSMVSDDESNHKAGFAVFGSGKLLADLLQYDPGGKFIFVGDPCQLPPITQSISPALSEEYILNTFQIKADVFELTDIVRQEDNNGIINASLQIRKRWEENPPVKWASLPLKGNNNIRFYSSAEQLLCRYLEKLSESGKENVSFLCHTNRQCLFFNQIIRKSINGEEVGIIVPGDLLMVTQNNYLCPLVNGDQVLVMSIGTRERRAGLTFLSVEVEELTSKNKYTLLLIEEILYSGATNINTQQHKALFVDFYLRMKSQGINQKSDLFKDQMMKDPYLNALRAVHGYALTCHKSQGGEWEEVFLYMDTKIHRIGKPKIYQWWYTAVTRAKTILHVPNAIFID